MTIFLIWLSLLCFFAYHRVRLVITTVLLVIALAILTHWQGMRSSTVLCWALTLGAFLPLNIRKWRRRYLMQPVFNAYRSMMPSLSKTEREAIAAGTVTWEGDLFRGNPNWHKLLALGTPVLSSEEQAFLDGPVKMLCHMINDWDITHNRADLPPEMWQFIKDQGFFGMIIPKEYGGKGFSAYAHSQVILMISGISITVSTTISVPNSLGPAELLLHYGTIEQKNYYLPRLAKGIEIPCFALTSPDAGSDASAMTDHGVVCRQIKEGQQILGIRLNWDKRYITLAPIATVIGLAFKLYDPDRLLGQTHDIGITCALIPRDTPGVTIGRRHFPLNAPFQNGPIQGKDVFIPLEWVIGGVQQVGHGWRMLMECLAAGRAITLPSSAVGGAKVACYTAGAYARIRHQFNMPIGQFEGIQELLARMAANTYVSDAARELTVNAIDHGAKPSVASAIIKYHTTELARRVSCDSMDIHGGKAICLGPNNYLGRGYESIPIAITVEGANVLTRNMIIFGQGVIRCHPYLLAEMEAVRLTDAKAGLKAFDNAFMKHTAFVISNMIRSVFLGLTGAYFVFAPTGKTKRYFQEASRFSAVFALLSDISMMVLGANLKRKESLSARLGDIHGYLYLLSAAMKRFHDQDQHLDDLPLLQYVGDDCLYQIQSRILEILQNFPNRIVACLLKMIIFPLGIRFLPPSDRLKQQVAKLLIAPTATRDRLTAGAYLAATHEHVFADLQDAMLKSIQAEPLEKMIRDAKREGLISGRDTSELVQEALNKNIINHDQMAILQQADTARRKVIAVDDFTTDELARLISIASQQHDYVK